MKEPVKALTYRFRWEDGREREFTVRLSNPGLSLETTPRRSLPAWTELGFNQCPNCPLKAADQPHCPVAVGLVDLVELFQDCLSTEVTEVTIQSKERQYRKTMSVMDGLSSLMGLHMAAAGCPILDKLRPMALTHLPFASLEETMYRSISMYLVAQLLLKKRGRTPDWDLKDLMRIFEEINAVNRSFVKRLQSAAPRDASINALVKLDCLAGHSRFSIDRTYLKSLEKSFAAYLE